MSALDARQLAALEQAAHWYTRLRSESAGPADHRAWQVWLESAAEHRWAWQQAERLQQRLQGMPTLGGRALQLAEQERHSSRRSVLKGFALLIGSGALGWGGYRQVERHGWLADYRSGIGERLAVRLADGSELRLNTDSAVNVRHDARQRLLILRHGEIMVTTAADPADRPFLVQTPQGLVQALGTRFSVRLEDDRAQVAVYEHRVRITPRQGAQTLLVAGQRCRFDSDGADTVEPLADGQDAWRNGRLVANDQRLGDFLAELAHHRVGWLRHDPAVADLRISGTFSLDDTDQALRALSDSLPVRLEQRTRYWVTVLPR
ncbi:Protein FecR [compost metagenome]